MLGGHVDIATDVPDCWCMKYYVRGLGDAKGNFPRLFHFEGGRGE
jgi:hypothetical protein